MRQRTTAYVIIPADDFLESLPEEIIELSDYGITVETLVATAVNAWSDINDKTSDDRFAYASPQIPFLKELGGLGAVCWILEMELISPIVSYVDNPDEFNKVFSVSQNIAITAFLHIDSYIDQLFNMYAVGEVSFIRFIGTSGIMLRYVQ